MKIRVCLKINGLAVTEDGKPAPAGLSLVVGESDHPIDYQELTESISKEGILRAACLDGMVKPEDMEFITPEEYDREYGDDDDA